MRVSVINFIPPRGRQETLTVDIPDDCAVGYEAIRRHNCRLTVERLMTGHISQCIEHEEGDYAIEICANSPKAPEVLAKMIRSFDSVAFEKWLLELTGCELDEEGIAF